MRVICITCGYEYESDEYDNCPNCGDDNSSTIEDLDEDDD